MDYSDYEGFSSPDADRSVLVDQQGRHRTMSLFWETSTASTRDKYPPLYTLADRSAHGLPSAYAIYQASVDEYDAAMRLVGSQKHWRKLASLNWFLNGPPGKWTDGLIVWRNDIMLRDASMAKRHLLVAANKGDTASARKLLDYSTPRADKPSVGRPVKEREGHEVKDESDRLERIRKLADQLGQDR